MGEAAASDEGFDVKRMMQHLEELQRERERLDAIFEDLAREDNQLVECVKQRVDERERIERRLLEIESENVDIEARRDALEDEQRALVESRDALDREYTELYALLDKAADDVAAPAEVAPAFTERLAGGIPVVKEAPLFARPAPWRTTLVIVPDPVAPAVAPVPVSVSWWKTTRGRLVLAASVVTVLAIGTLAAWPADPPPPAVDPRASLELVRAAFMPSEDAAPPAAPAVVADAPAIVAPASESPPPRTQRKRARSKAKSKTKKP